MKLARLLLQAFGPFTDTELDFTGNGARPEANLHLIYGPNEAGKSSALRAMTDLRFGIPLRSPDDFVHPTSQLRIAGVFIDTDGKPIGLVRRKGRGETLSRFDMATGQPTTPPDVGRDQELALTGGLGRDEFEAMFGINHARLRAGGEMLLKGEGELGSALFEASAGTRGIVAILASLEADAKALFNPHGRAQSAIINEARRQLDEQRHLWKQAQTRPADWQALYRAHEQAKDALAEVDRALEAQRRRENELTELRTVEPLLREHDRALAELQTLADIADLPENAREDRLAAEQALRRAEQDLHDAELELTRCAEAVDDLVIEAPLLEHAEAIERLAASVETLVRARIETRQQQAVIERIEADLAASIARIAPRQSVDSLINATPSAADRTALDTHLGTISRLVERLEGYRSRIEELEQTEKLDADDIPILPDPEARELLGISLRNAQALGDVSQQTTKLEEEINGLNSQLKRALSDLGLKSVDELRCARPLLDDQIVTFREAWTNIDQAEARLRDEDQRLQVDLDQQRLRERQLAAMGEVVTADTLRLTRERRDKGWGLIRQAYVERSHDAHELGGGFDPERQLPEAFEVAQGEADRQADLLRADAARAAGYEECTARIEDMDKRRSGIADELAQLASRRQDTQADWSRRLTEAHLPDLSPEALREWKAERKAALDIADRLVQSEAERDRLQAALTAASSSLTAAIKGVGQTAVGTTLPSLIDQADRWEKQATKDGAKHDEHAKSKQQRRMERDKVAGQIKKAEDELLGHQAAIQDWHVRLFLDPNSLPEAVKARLDELDDFSKQSAALGEARLKQSQQLAVIQDFSTRASDIATLLGEPIPEMPDDFADRMKGRLNSSREQEQLRRTLNRDRARAQERKRNAETERTTQSTILSNLCVAARVEAAANLPDREDDATRKRLAQATLTAHQQQLAKASIHTVDELRERLAGLDAIAIDGERERCRDEISRFEQEQVKARQAEEQTRRALEAVDDSDAAAKAREAMESAAARYRSAIRPWARLKLAHALLQEALNRFRERAQAPMVAAASGYFELMTGGRYKRLVADEADDKPVLRAERADGVRIGVEAMSEGTADQLYLALRLAALELRRASHPQMPLILDDVLVTSDDERAANILRALARFAEGGQVMIFTHHRHLVDLAQVTVGEQGLVTHTL